MSRPSLLILLLLFSSALCAAEPAPDQRAPIRLKAQEKAQIHAEMRMFLSVTQKIVAGVAANDMMAVAAAAHEAGMASAGDMPDSVRVKLPLPFKQLGHATHMAFDDLARDAESLGDANQALKQLGQALDRCVACHAIYRIETR